MITLSTYSDRLMLTRGVMQLLADWQLQVTEQITLLDLPKETSFRMLQRYHTNTPLPEEPHIMERVEHLLNIGDILLTTYPHNARMGAQWLHTPQRRFQRRTPLQVMISGGLNGLIEIRAHLDCAYAWSLTEPGNKL